jgi:hypothetical protein
VVDGARECPSGAPASRAAGPPRGDGLPNDRGSYTPAREPSGRSH